MSPSLVGSNIDTFIANARIGGDFPDDLAHELDELKIQAQEAEEDRPTCFAFAGEILYIKPHGAGRQWRWILHSPSLHLDVGKGKLTHIAVKARLSAAFLWEHEIGESLAYLYSFLASFLGVPFTLQVSEVHLCVDVAGWEPRLGDLGAFITRSRSKGLRLEELDEEDDNDELVPPELRLQFTGRRLTTLDFSKGSPHACCIYDKTAELIVSRKDWMHEVWLANGWDGESRITRIEFRSKRECLRELGIEEAYAYLDQLPSHWAYSTKKWLRHTVPNGDPNRARWPLSPVWELVQQASFFCDGTPGVRERRTAGNLKLLCQMITGCSTSAAAYLGQTLPEWDDGANFLSWYLAWQDNYLQEKETDFASIRREKATRFGTMSETPSL